MRLCALLLTSFALSIPALAGPPGFTTGKPDPWEYVSAHRITFTGGKSIVGLAVNPNDPDQFLAVKTVKGRMFYPRDKIAKIEPEKVPAWLVYTGEERYELRVAKAPPATPEDHLELARWCMDIGAFREAVPHFRKAGAEDGASKAESLIGKVGLLNEVLELRDGRKYEEALRRIEDLREGNQLPDSYLDSLERGIRERAARSLRKHVHLLFCRTLQNILDKKLQDKSLTLNAARSWAAGPKGLAEEVFSRIAEITGLTAKEAREIWEGRKNSRIYRFNFGPGTFLHAEVLQRAGKAPPPGPRSGEEWWKAQKGRKVKMMFLQAWFAEFGGGELDVLRIENRPCATCGGKGVQISRAAVGGRQVRTICPTCNFAGHERIVICR